jgi:hypothetical protein
MEEEEKPIVISFDIGIKNLACCCLTYDLDSVIYHWDLHPLVEEDRKSKLPMDATAMRIFEEMDRICASVPRIDYVLLENQPSRINGTMKTIQMIIYTFFQYKKYNEGKIKDVLLISANKKTAEPPFTIDMSGCKAKSKYTQRKYKSVKLTEKYVEACPVLVDLLGKYKKKDDICDALTQALAWMRSKGLQDVRLTDLKTYP